MKLPPPPSDYRKSHEKIGGWLYRRRLSCQHFTELSLVAADRPLGIGEHARRLAHFLVCSVCRKFNKQMKVLRHLVRLYVIGLTKTSPSERFLQQLRDQLATQAANQPSTSKNSHD